MDKTKNKDMYKLYEEYKNTMAISKKVRNKRQKMNREIREKYDEPYKRRDHVDNVNDITHWNSMIRDLEEDMKMIEMYLDFEDRYYLHKEYNDTKSMIYNQNSYEGIVPLEEIFGETTSNINVIYTNELQREIVILLNNLLTERQKQIVYMLFWMRMTQDEVAKELGLTQQGVADSLKKSFKKLKNSSEMYRLFQEFKEVCN